MNEGRDEVKGRRGYFAGFVLLLHMLRLLREKLKSEAEESRCPQKRRRHQMFDKDLVGGGESECNRGGRDENAPKTGKGRR